MCGTQKEVGTLRTEGLGLKVLDAKLGTKGLTRPCSVLNTRLLQVHEAETGLRILAW